MSDNGAGVIPPNESDGVGVTRTESGGTTMSSEPGKATYTSGDLTQGAC